MGVGLKFGIGPLRVYIPLSGGHRRRRRRRKGGRTTRPAPAPYWTHAGCTIHHRTQDAANRCTTPAPVRSTAVLAQTPVPAGRTTRLPKTRLEWAVFGIILAVVIGFVATHQTPTPAATTPARTQVVTRAGFTGYGGWPFTVDSVTLSCSGYVVLYTAGGVTYEQFPTPGNGHANVDAITANDPKFPGTKMSLIELSNEGLSLC